MSKITLAITIVCVLVLLVPATVFFVVYEKVRPEIIKENLDKKTAETASVLNGELRFDCQGQYDYLIQNYGADYSKCYSVFNFDKDSCGWFDIESQSLSNVNIVVILDASGSMAELIDSSRKIDVAKQAIVKFLTNMPKGINTSLIVYGHKGSGSLAGKDISCEAVEQVVSLSQNNSSNIISAINSFGPNGWTPIAKSLDLARSIFETRRNDKNHLILVSDGIETCDGDPAASAKNLITLSPNRFSTLKLDIIGLGKMKESDGNFLRQIASAGKGTYISADSSDKITNEFNRQLSLIKRSCLTATLHTALLKYKDNDFDNLNCWQKAYSQESQSYKDLERFFNPDCRVKISENLNNRSLDFWNKNQTLESSNEATYKSIEKDLISQLEILDIK